MSPLTEAVRLSAVFMLHSARIHPCPAHTSPPSNTHLSVLVGAMSHTHTSLTYPTLALAFFFLTVVSAEIRTIDDTYGDSVTGVLPAYSDTNCWNPNPCSICTLQPNASRTYNGTWHDTTRSLSGEFSVAKSIEISFIGESFAHCTMN